MKQEYRFKVEREAWNAWLLIREIYNPNFGWIEQPGITFHTKASAEMAGENWLKDKSTIQDMV